MDGGACPVEDIYLGIRRGVFANGARGRWRSGDHARGAPDGKATDGGIRVDDVELLWSAAKRPAALCTCGHLGEDQVVDAVPTCRPKRVRARLAEEQDLGASGLQLVHV